MAGHAVRLAQGVDGVAVEIGDGLAENLVGRAGVELHVARHRQRVGPALFQRLADVERLDPGEIVGPRLHEIAERQHQASALGCGELSPVSGERPLGRGDRGVDVGRRPARDRADRDAARRVFQRQAFAGQRGDPAAADEALVGRIPGKL